MNQIEKTLKFNEFPFSLTHSHAAFLPLLSSASHEVHEETRKCLIRDATMMMFTRREMKAGEKRGRERESRLRDSLGRER